MVISWLIGCVIYGSTKKIVLACSKCGSRNYITSAKIDRDKRFAIKKIL